MKSKTNPISKNISEVERVKLDLLSLVSHELRTPLSLVLNSLRSIREDSLSVSEREEFLDIALRNADVLNLKLNQLLDLSKLASGRLVCRFQEVSLKQFLLRNLEWLENEAKKRKINLQVQGDFEKLPIILGDAPRLDKVIYSLFENAIKFAKENSTLKVELKSKNKNAGPITLSIRNELIAPLSTEVGKLLHIFSQQEPVLERKFEGVGGSLAVAAEVLSQHGGELRISSDEKTFEAEISIPLLVGQEALYKLLESRLFALRTEVGAVSLMVLEIDDKESKPLSESIKSVLFRASDFVYPIEGRARSIIAVVLDDCKKEDAPKIIERLLSKLGSESRKLLSGSHPKIGFSSCPNDTTDPQKLVELAITNLREFE